MLINSAMAAGEAADKAGKTSADQGASALQGLGEIVGMSLLLITLFYILVLRPQKQRYREHVNMLSGLKKGDKVITQGGLVATVHKIRENGELVVDLGENMRVTLLRNSVASKYEDAATGNDNSHDKTAIENDAADTDK